MGVFLSITGWSDHVPEFVKQEREKKIILTDGYDLRLPLDTDFNFRQLLDKKIEALRLYAEPFFSAANLQR